MSAGVRIDGLRETVRTLERFGVQVSDLKAAFLKIGKKVTQDAQTLAPHKTGRLAGSIKPSNTKNKSVIRAGGARIPYAGVIHYGGYNNIKPHPFLTDAVSRNESVALSIMEEELNGLIHRLGLNT